MPYAVPAPSPPSPPSPSSSSSSSSIAPPTPVRPQHRRTRSSFTDERGPGAFVSLGALPRRRPSATKKAVFHLNPDDSPPEDVHDSYDLRQASLPTSPAVDMRDGIGGYSHLGSLRYARDTGKFSPSVNPPSHIDLPPLTTSSSSFSSDPVPFPTSSPLPSPNSLPEKFRNSPLVLSPSTASSIPRTPSTPIILSNGKALKSSLKSSSSTPNIPYDMLRTKHLRAQSAPSTPNMHKNVHFAENGLESVRVFNRTGKPKSVSKPPGDETETETEAENSNAERGMGGSFPFPSQSGSSSLGLSVPSGSQNVMHEIDTSPQKTSAIPTPSPSPSANIHVETVTLPRTRPPTLRGTVLVRNLAFEKNVAVRFTLDEWQTTSEVLCKHVVSLPSLPPPFPRHEARKDERNGDVASRIVNGLKTEEEKVATWDRFSFTIRLEDYEAKLADRTLWLVARFGIPGGEWWDNNEHHNYRIGFRKATYSSSLSPLATPVPSAFSSLPSGKEKDNDTVTIPSIPPQLLTPVSQQRSFSAPNTLRYTPMTGTLAGIPVVSSPPTSSGKSLPAPPMLVRSMSSPYPPSPSLHMELGMDTSLSPSMSLQHIPTPTSPIARETAARTSSYIRRKLNLSNYVAPGSSPTEERKVTIEGNGGKEEGAAGLKGLVTPPTTPPGTVRVKGVGLPVSLHRLASPPPPSPIGDDEDDGEKAEEGPEHDDGMEDKEEGDEPIGEIPSEQEEEDDDTPKEEKGLRLDTTTLPTTSASDEHLPFSPTSVKAITRPSFLAFNQGGLMSPPGSREASEDGGSGEGGRSSPTPAVANDINNGSSQSQPGSEGSMHLVLPPLGLNFAHDTLSSNAAHHERHPAESDSPSYGPSRTVDTSDSSYAAFVRQWCFAQSTPPTPGVLHTATSVSSPASSSSSHTPTPLPTGATPSSSARSGQWMGLGVGGGLGVVGGGGGGYGFPGFSFGVSPDVGLVGGDMR